MADEDDLERRLHQLEHDHRLTRWYTGRIDRDLAEIATTQQEHTELLRGLVGTADSMATQLQGLNSSTDSIATRLEGLTGKTDSIEAQLGSLAGATDSMALQMRGPTQLVGEVLRRLPDPDAGQQGAAEGIAE